MIDTKITLTTDCGALGVFLHPPGQATPYPLPGVSHTNTQQLAPGVYAVSIAGTGNLPGTNVKVKIEAATSKVRNRFVRNDGTINAWITFELLANGEVA